VFTSLITTNHQFCSACCGPEPITIITHTAYFRTLYQVANALASLQGETIEGILRSRENSVDLTQSREYSVDLAQGDVQLPELRRERNVRDAITAQQVPHVACCSVTVLCGAVLCSVCCVVLCCPVRCCTVAVWCCTVHAVDVSYGCCYTSDSSGVGLIHDS
jgi:hypothetical protein